MRRIHKEKEKLYEIAASGRLEGLCECMKDDRESESYYVRRDKAEDYLVRYDFDNLKELQGMLKSRSRLLQDDELKTLICAAAFKMKHIYEADDIEKDRGDEHDKQELPVFIYNM